MRINADKYRAIAGQAGITDRAVGERTGLSQKTLSWILESGFIEVQTLELVADALGCTAGELAMPDPAMGGENVIEWQKGQQRATVTLSQQRVISRVEKLAGEHPGQCEIVARHKDGTLCAHIPVAWIKINQPKALTEKQLEQARINLLKAPNAGQD